MKGLYMFMLIVLFATALFILPYLLKNWYDDYKYNERKRKYKLFD